MQLSKPDLPTQAVDDSQGRVDRLEVPSNLRPGRMYSARASTFHSLTEHEITAFTTPSERERVPLFYCGCGLHVGRGEKSEGIFGCKSEAPRENPDREGL